MKTKEFEFNGDAVTFETERGNVMVNATEMGKIFGKQVNEFMSNQNTIEFIRVALNNGNSRYLNIEKEEDLVISKQKIGTYMHRVLALKFAAWLNPEFELWVYSTIDELMFGSYKDDDESLKAIAKKQIAITEKEEQLEKSPLIKEIEELRKEIRSEQNKMKLRKDIRLSSFRSIFTEDEMTGEEKDE